MRRAMSTEGGAYTTEDRILVGGSVAECPGYGNVRMALFEGTVVRSLRDIIVWMLSQPSLRRKVLCNRPFDGITRARL